MEEDVEVIIGRAGIPDDKTSFQTVLAEGDRVRQVKVVIPFAVG